MVRHTIAICTRNRANLLNRTLGEIIRQVEDQPDVEILVVDNASDDRTKDTVSAYPRIRYIYEQSLGIAYARNRAIDEGRGDWLTYIDDDAFPCATWWSCLRNTAENETLSPDCILGKVSLEWEGGRPQWFPTKYETLLSRYDLGDQLLELKAGGYLLTTNAAFRRKTLIELGGFNTDLGHRGNNLLGGEDNDIFNRLIGKNCRILYLPDMEVLHWVPKKRQEFRWLARRVFWDGATQPLLDYGPGLPMSHYAREIGRDVRRGIRLALSHWHQFGKAEGWRLALLAICQQSGRLWMNWRLLRGCISAS